jgi:hypothetical protein
VMACIAAMLTGGCKSRNGDVQTTTETTIKLPKPSEAPTPAANSDDALTQTIDIEDSRSVAEGGTLTDKSTTAKTGTVVTGQRKSVTKTKAEGRKQK